MFAQLSNIVFTSQVSPTSDSESLEISYASHELINNVTRLQPSGRNPLEKELEMYFHSSFINVKEAIANLYKKATSYEVMTLIYGSGEVVGDFVITNITKKTEHAFADGTIHAATVTVSLKEFVQDKLQVKQNEATVKAKAVNKKPVTGKKATAGPSQSQLACSRKISDRVSQVNSNLRVVTDSNNTYQGTSDINNSSQLARKISNGANTIAALCSDIISKDKACLNDQLINSFFDVQFAALQVANAASVVFPYTSTVHAAVNIKVTHLETKVTFLKAAVKQSQLASITRHG